MCRTLPHAAGAQVFVPLFQQRWGFTSVDPCLSIRDMASLQLSQFVHLCKLERGDTLQSLALRHDCTEMDLRVLNNLLSERALSAYSSLFVPISDEAQLQGKVLRLQHVGAMHRVLPVRCAARMHCLPGIGECLLIDRHLASHTQLRGAQGFSCRMVVVVRVLPFWSSLSAAS